jgi:hypothetical protein
VREPELPAQIGGGDVRDAVHVDAIVHDGDARARDAVGREDVGNRLGRRDEAGNLPVLPARERVFLQVEVDAPRGDERGRGRGHAEGERHRRHRHGVRVVRMHHVGAVHRDDAGEPPGGRQVDLRTWRERHQIVAFAGALIQHALRVRHEHGPVAARAHPEHGQQDLLLPAAPGAGGVEVECEHNSQSLANFRAT